MVKKIFYISYDFGFLSIHAHEIISNMLMSGVRVDLFMPAGVQPNLTISRNCVIHRIPVYFTNPLLKIIVFNILLVYSILFTITKNAMPDIIYARQNYSGIIPILLSRLFKIPYFSEINSIILRSKSEKYTLKSKIKLIMERLSLKLANLIITPSLTLKNSIVERHRISSEKIHVVSNGVNEKLFFPSDKRSSLRKILGIESDDFVAGFVGSMGKWQGLDVLKGAILKALDANDEIKFLIVGDFIRDSNHSKMKAGLGEAAKDIKNFIRANDLTDKVIYHKFVDYEKTVNFMNVCDVLLAPYTSEYHERAGGSPMKLYAYLGCAKPVIISDLGELTDSFELQKHKAAYLIPPDDSEALAKAVLYFKENENAVRNYGQNGRAFILKARKWSHSCNKILSIQPR